MNTPKNVIYILSMIIVFIHACSGSDDSDGVPGAGPHLIRYEVVGGSGVINVADITYIDSNGNEQAVSDEPIPWGYSFKASPDANLSLTAILHGSGTTTLYVSIYVDNECRTDYRTFVTESSISLSGTPRGILTTCPNHVGTTDN